MNNLVCMPTGPLIEEMIEKGKIDLKKVFGKYDIDGLEITFGYKHRIYGFKIDKEQEKWLKGLKYVSLHAPFGFVSRSENKEEIKKQMDLLQKIYKQVNAKALILHPHECPYELLKNYKMNYALENMPLRHYRNNNKINQDMLKQKYGFCLDTAHASDFGEKEIEKLYKKMKKKLVQIHLSGVINKEHHQSLVDSPKEYIDSLKGLRETNVPLILEINFTDLSVRAVNKEIRFARKMFKKS
ncbi:MAG: hypothetical protein PHH82_03435 [Candidatus ainarchaeum sp.]|nr:hypothetical protein [Candidatus ainarchaeum sp.]